MSRRLLLSASAIVLGLGLAAASPAWAQVVVPDASIEGPLQSVTHTSGSITLDGELVTWVGEMRVMDVTVRVLEDATIHSPTATLTLNQVDAPPALPGRSQNGFLGGTAIVTGASAAGILYATDVFVEPAENVIVGEATGAVDGDVTVNNVRAVALTDPRIPAGPPINGFGFEVIPSTIPVNSLLAIEGYFAEGTPKGVLHYHTLEADGGTLVRAGTREVSILRAQCRIRGGGRDELEVRGGTHNPAATPVTIEISDPTITTPTPAQPEVGWRRLTPTAAPVVDTTVTPRQGLYRFRRDNLNLPGSVCPAFVRASVANHATHSDVFAPDAR
jgi:hypothetical protein